MPEKNRFAALRTMKLGAQNSGTKPAEDVAIADPPQRLMPTPAMASSATPRKVNNNIPKRNDPRYQQVNTYILKPLHKLVWLELVKQSPRGQFDTLLNDLLRNWLVEKGITKDLDGNSV